MYILYTIYNICILYSNSETAFLWLVVSLVTLDTSSDHQINIVLFCCCTLYSVQGTV